MCKMLLEYEELEENHGVGENREEWCYLKNCDGMIL